MGRWNGRGGGFEIDQIQLPAPSLKDTAAPAMGEKGAELTSCGVLCVSPLAGLLLRRSPWWVGRSWIFTLSIPESPL